MRFALIILSTLISGCSFYDRLGNKPYTFPADSEPNSEIVVNYDNNSWFNIFNMDKNGCFAGTSVIGQSGETVKIHSNTDTFLSLENRTPGSFCRIIFSFTPEQHTKYNFTQGTHFEDKPGISGFFSGPDIYCTLSGEKILATGKREPLILKKMNLRPSGLACLRMREASNSKW
jgi:hypothetical protein